MLAELACALRVPEGTLSRRLARQAALAAFPRLREANLAGLVSSWHCDAMLDVFAGVADEAALAAADAILVDKALASTASELRVSARRWRARHVPRTDEERRRNLADRRVELAPADDDLCWLTALLPAAQAMAIYHRLSDVAAQAAGPDEPRTADQLRADAMCELLLGRVEGRGSGVTGSEPARGAVDRAPAAGEGSAEAEGRVSSADGSSAGGREHDAPASRDVVTVGDGLHGIVPTVILTVPVLSLLGHSQEPADLEGFGPIDLETARRLCASAPSFLRVLTHPETGAVLSVGRDRYRVPADLKTALVVRDETCRFPGCRRRAVRCDLDHATDWQYGGGSDVDNLEHLCRKHHRLKHQLGWRVAHDGGGHLTWTSPTGARHPTAPAREVPEVREAQWRRPPSRRMVEPAAPGP